jgi:hypothetical protein
VGQLLYNTILKKHSEQAVMEQYLELVAKTLFLIKKEKNNLFFI